MNKDDIHPLRTKQHFFSTLLLGIRRLAALTRSPVPIGWARLADGRARGNSLARSILDVVGCWLLGIALWMLRVGRLNRPRHARIASLFACPSSRRRNSPLTPP